MPKKVDKAKQEAKKARKQEKVEKKTLKRNKKEQKDSGEEDIEKIIAEFANKDSKRTAVSVYPCNQPSPRSNFSLTSFPNGDIILFGGEFSDGLGTTVYNDLFRWNIDKNEWKQIESLNTPPPRCSHQAVYYKEKIYMFGGEYATLDQFHHYKDFWSLDLKTNAWTEIKATGEAPSARSGHRMVVWRNYLILFGGFYEAMRDLRWFNDLFFYSFQEEKWILVKYKPHAQVPKPRSGVSMALHNNEDILYIYGGYSKEKNPGQKKEGKIHDDMWCIDLKLLLITLGSSGSGGKQSIDMNKVAWQRVSRKGHFPSSRCGSSFITYKNKAILFGGVFDDEGPQHSLVSTFYNDMYAFDMERKRWYQLGVKKPKEAKGPRLKKPRLKTTLSTHKEHNGNNNNNDDEDDEEYDNDSDDNKKGDSDEDDNDDDDMEDENNEEEEEEDKDILANGNYFGYIDDNGVVVYMDLDSDAVISTDTDTDTDTITATTSATNDTTTTSPSTTDTTKSSSSLQSEVVHSSVHSEEKISTENSTTTTDVYIEDIRMKIENATIIECTENTVGNMTADNNVDVDMGESDSILTNKRKHPLDVTPLDSPSTLVNIKGPNTTAIITTLTTTVMKKDIINTASDMTNLVTNQTSLSKYFLDRTEPSPRINPCLIIRGNLLYLYGGVTELGDIEVTLDDCWCIDLSRRDMWKPILRGTMDTLIWKGDDGEGTEASDDRTQDSDDDNSDEEDDDDDDDDNEDDEVGDNIKSPNMKKSNQTSSSSSSSKKHSKSNKQQSGENTTAAVSGIREEMAVLRGQLDTTDSNRTPMYGETLKIFYGRTTEYWTQEAIKQWNDKNTTTLTTSHSKHALEPLSEKELKREGFLLSEIRYNEILPVLARLNELEEQQRIQEEENDNYNYGNKGGGGGKNKGKNSNSKRR